MPDDFSFNTGGPEVVSEHRLADQLTAVWRTSAGRSFEQGQMLQMVIPEHEEDALVETGRYESQVLHGKISRAQYKICIGKSRSNCRAVDQGVNVVGDAQYSHAPVTIRSSATEPAICLSRTDRLVETGRTLLLHG